MHRLLLAGLLLSTVALGLPNPASVYCTQRHFQEVMLSDEAGWSGFCLFPDYSYCDEWQYFHGQCQPGRFYWPEKHVDARNPGKYCLVLDDKNHILVMRCKTPRKISDREIP